MRNQKKNLFVCVFLLIIHLKYQCSQRHHHCIFHAEKKDNTVKHKQEESNDGKRLNKLLAHALCLIMKLWDFHLFHNKSKPLIFFFLYLRPRVSII